MPSPASLIDNHHNVETPEGIELSAVVAGPVPRALAYTIDFCIRIAVWLILFLLLLFAGEAGRGILLIIWFVLEWFYPVLFEVLREGQTPGKRIMGIMASNDDLTPITFSTSLIRNVLRTVDFLPFFYSTGIISMCLSQRFQRLGDMAAGSIVIYKGLEDGVNLSAPLTTESDIVAAAPPTGLSQEDQVALIRFLQKSPYLSEQRRVELAELLSPLTNKRQSAAVHTLHAYGAWLLGERR